MSLSDQESDAVLHYQCPRCHAEVSKAWYGPCASCRLALRTSMHVTARNTEAPLYEPKVNVTPNAVAIKE